jgi:hypothetical protein
MTGIISESCVGGRYILSFFYKRCRMFGLSEMILGKLVARFNKVQLRAAFLDSVALRQM